MEGTGELQMIVNAHFDGKVIVPDQPINFQPNQALIVHIEPINNEPELAAESTLTWLASNAIESATQPEDLAHQHDHSLYGLPAKVKHG